jgi:hypothetical protein
MQLLYYLIYVTVEIGTAQKPSGFKEVYYQGLPRRRLLIFSGKLFAAWTHVI